MPQSQARLNSGQYTFTPSSKQISFAAIAGFSLEGLIEVYHVPSGNTIYDTYDPTLGGTVSGSTVTLQFDTTGTYGNGVSYAPSDPLRIMYNDLTRDDQVIVYNPTATGPLPSIPIKSAQTLILDIQSSTSITCQVDVSMDNVNWKTGLNGRLPNLYANGGDANANNGAPFNTRQYDVSQYMYTRINVQSISPGTPRLNVSLKTFPSPTRDIFVVGGSITSNFDSGGSVGYVRTTNLYTELLQGALTASATFTGSSRQAFGYPNPYYPRFGATVISDQPCKLIFQFSIDNTNWITQKTVQVQAGVMLEEFVRIVGQWHRVLVVNDGTANATKGLTIMSYYTAS